MFRFLTILGFLVGGSASATITMLGVSGVSGSINIPTPTVQTTPGQILTATIYGGMGGADCSGGGGSTCNSCNGTVGQACPNSQTMTDGSTASWPFCVCNTNRIGDDVMVNFSFYSNTQGGIPALESNQTGNTGNFIYGSNLTFININSTAVLNVTWGQICSAAFSTSGNTCSGITTGQTETITLGLVNGNTSTTGFADSIQISVEVLAPTNNQIDDCTGSVGGICAWRSYPADSGIYLENIQGDGGFNGTTIVGIRVFASGTDFDHAAPGLADAQQDMQVNSDGTVPSNFMGGLTNDPTIPYHFRIATLDPAGNVFNFTSNYNIQQPQFGNCTYPVDSSYTDACNYHAEPDQVLGLLSKDVNCFIATAAYGSSMEPKINTFRAFRHRYLLLNPLGRKFVMAYYTWGPYAARWIHDREWARAAARALLWPVWGFADLSLKWGLERVFAGVVSGLVLLLALIIGIATRRSRSAIQT